VSGYRRPPAAYCDALAELFGPSLPLWEKIVIPEFVDALQRAERKLYEAAMLFSDQEDVARVCALAAAAGRLKIAFQTGAGIREALATYNHAIDEAPKC